MPLNQVDRQLLLAYLEGNCTTDQLRQIKEYLTNDAYRDSLNDFMQEEWAWLSTVDFPALPGMTEQYAKFRFYLARREKDEPSDKAVQRTPVRRLYTLLTIAAALLILIVSAWVLRTLFNRHQAQQMAAAELYYHNEPGHQTIVQLPDSSRVYLGAASTLRYKQSAHGNRLVQLEGQAYFEVRHDERRPFTVKTGSITTVDIGTAFNIRYYRDNPSIEVIVSNGKVQVLHKKDQADAPIAVVDPGQRFQYDTATKQYEITPFTNTDLAGAWRKGILSFRRERLKDVTDELQRYFGVQFQYTDPASADIVITTLLDNKSLEEALDIVTLTAGIQFSRQKNLIILK